jgi:peptide/nickel transport system ATP-binding protein
VPPLYALPQGCAFAPRCPHADETCRAVYPDYIERRPGHWAACWHAERLYGDGA